MGYGLLDENQANARVNSMTVVKASPRRKELVGIAARLFVEVGFERTTVRMLAQAMGIKSGSLFHHFRDKQEILFAVIEEGMHNALAIARKALGEANGSPRARLDALARAHLETLFTDRNAHVVALYEWRSLNERSHAHLVQLRDEYESLWHEVIDQALEARLLHGDPFLVRHFLLGALNWTVRWYDPEGPRSPESLAQGLIGMISHAHGAIALPPNAGRTS